jgi:two-component system sensor kinase FixL
MPETHLNPEKKIVIKNVPKGSKAKVLFDQKNGVLMTRIQVLEQENTEFIRLLKKEKQLNLEKAQSLSTASHDCRSPLTSIQLSAALIERYYDRLDQQKLFAHLEKIKLAVIELTDQLNALIEI